MYSFISCSTVPGVCQAQGAYQLGKDQAASGLRANHHQGDICSQEHYITFMQNFEQGYADGKRLFCDVGRLNEQGYETAISGQSSKFESENLTICSQRSTLKKAYQKGFMRGLEIYCSEDFNRQTGFNQGKLGQAGAFTIGAYHQCSDRKREQIDRAFHEGYAKGIDHFCQIKNIQSAARESAARQQDLQFPYKFQICLNIYPDRSQIFANTFNREREYLISSRCHYGEGVIRGNKDAISKKDQDLNMPSYCDGERFMAYRKGYVESWTQKKEEICSEAIAREQGKRDSIRGFSAFVNLPMVCPTHYAAKYSLAYHKAYHRSRELMARKKIKTRVIVIENNVRKPVIIKKTKVITRIRPKRTSRIITRIKPNLTSRVITRRKPNRTSRIITRRKPNRATRVITRRKPNRATRVITRTKRAKRVFAQTNTTPSRRSKFHRSQVHAVKVCVKSGFSHALCRHPSVKECIIRGKRPRYCIAKTKM